MILSGNHFGKICEICINIHVRLVLAVMPLLGHTKYSAHLANPGRQNNLPSGRETENGSHSTFPEIYAYYLLKGKMHKKNSFRHMKLPG